MIGFDVVIIGGGLSGSSTALNLSKKGYSVLIIEKEKFQDYMWISTERVSKNWCRDRNWCNANSIITSS